MDFVFDEQGCVDIPPFQESNRHQDDDPSLGVRIRKKKKNSLSQCY